MEPICAFWIVCVFVNFGLFIWGWTADLDLDFGDAVFFGMMSLLGPAALPAALVLASFALPTIFPRLGRPLMRRRQQ